VGRILPSEHACGSEVLAGKGISGRDRPRKMSENVPDLHRQQQLYWNEMIDLKSEASYIRLYRDSLGRWVTSIGALKAIASSAGIAAWVIWKEYAFVWGFIIALSQVADALKDVFPFARKYKAASVYSMTIDNLFNDVQLEWDNISSGRYTDEEIMKRLHQLRKLRLMPCSIISQTDWQRETRLLFKPNKLLKIIFKPHMV
jgi:hypothetical protein